MVEEGLMTDETVEFLEENYDKDFYLGMAWKVGRPVYLITNLGFNQDYAADLSQAIASNPDYTDEIDFSVNLTSGMYNPDMCNLQPKDFKHTDSMHLSYAQLNTTYVVRSLIYILVRTYTIRISLKSFSPFVMRNELFTCNPYNFFVSHNCLFLN
jgi:hypothetical protein